MISQLHGVLIEASPSTAVIEAAGIGFELGISGITAASLPALGEEVRVYTRMQVREDACALYGFATKEERAMFDHLVAVSGVGPKLALSVLSKYTVSQLYSVVMAEDQKGLVAVPGVGKKMAQRLILELKGALAKSQGLSSTTVPGRGQAPLPPTAPASAMEDARAALLSMGFTVQEIDLALSGYDDRDMRVEELLAAALRRLGMDA